MISSIIKLSASLLLTFSAAALGSLVTFPEIKTWYVLINKPFFTPPNWLFGPVWTILYVLMAISFYSIWVEKTDNKEKKVTMGIFIIQLVLNFLWSYVFFGLHLLWPAYGIIIALWVFVLICILKFRKYSRLASNLLIPYLLWVSFASFLNLAVAILN